MRSIGHAKVEEPRAAKTSVGNGCVMGKPQPPHEGHWPGDSSGAALSAIVPPRFPLVGTGAGVPSAKPLNAPSSTQVPPAHGFSLGHKPLQHRAGAVNFRYARNYRRHRLTGSRRDIFLQIQGGGVVLCHPAYRGARASPFGNMLNKAEIACGRFRGVRSAIGNDKPNEALSAAFEGAAPSWLVEP